MHGKTSIGSWEVELENTLSVNGAKNDKIIYKEIFTARDASVAQLTSVEFHTSHGPLGVHLG